MTFRPTELPLMRMQTLCDLDAASASLPPGAEARLSATAGATDLPEVLRGWLIQSASPGELFHVSADMTSLAKASSLTLPDFALQEFDFVSPSGYMIFDAPIIRMSEMGAEGADAPEIVGVMWHLVAQQGLAALGYLVREQGRTLCHSVGFILVGDLTAAHKTGWADEAHGRIQGVLKATWLLMRQPLASETPVSFDRATRRRMQRADVTPRQVRVVALRRPKTASTSAESDREYHHRWIVRGHWRQQWYPARQVHRPVWIAPHLKGPDDAPLLGGEKVHAWRR